MSQTDFWKSHPCTFHTYIFIMPGHTIHEKKLSLKHVTWMSFPENGLCHPLNSKIGDWMSFPKVGLANDSWPDFEQS